MRSKLQKFTDFANGLLPHETSYLISIQSFEDPLRLQILERVHHNAQHIEQFIPYDPDIDKRKYNHLKNWINHRLASIDVDQQFSWIHKMEEKVVTDAIQAKEERQLLKVVKDYQHPWHYFTSLYEMLDNYRHFLLIRMRYSDHEVVNDFIQTYKGDYELSKKVSERIHEATRDIVNQYSGQSIQSDHWKAWLEEVFYNESLDGLNRYMALVRLVFIAHNHRQYDALKEKFEYLESNIVKGKDYSKRLLLNYYNNRLMMHTNFKEYKEAMYYGNLSIRYPSHDRLLYVNNLCAVLLRQNAHQEALELMQRVAPDVRKTTNMHNRIGFIAFYMEALIKNGLYKNAERFGDSFLNAYSKDILKFRWHLFFSIYLESMIYLEHFSKIIRLVKRFDLIGKDEAYRSKNNYSPVIRVFYKLAEYKEGIIRESGFQAALDDMNIEMRVQDFKRSGYPNIIARIKRLETD